MFLQNKFKSLFLASILALPCLSFADSIMSPGSQIFDITEQTSSGQIVPMVLGQVNKVPRVVSSVTGYYLRQITSVACSQSTYPPPCPQGGTLSVAQNGSSYTDTCTISTTPTTTCLSGTTINQAWNLCYIPTLNMSQASQLIGMYALILNRNPDLDGYNYWLGNWPSLPLTLSEVKDFVTSASTDGEPYVCGINNPSGTPTNPHNIDALGVNVISEFAWFLGRCPTQTEYDFWDNAANNFSSAADIANSGTCQVSYYQGTCNGSTANSGTCTTSTQASTSCPANTVFDANAKACYVPGANPSDSNGVLGVYQVAFGRMPDPGGQAFWVNAFGTGSLQQWQIQSIINVGASNGYENICGFGYRPFVADSLKSQIVSSYIYNAGRCPDSGGYAYWFSLGYAPTTQDFLNNPYEPRPIPNPPTVWGGCPSGTYSNGLQCITSPTYYCNPGTGTSDGAGNCITSYTSTCNSGDGSTNSSGTCTHRFCPINDLCSPTGSCPKPPTLQNSCPLGTNYNASHATCTTSPYINCPTDHAYSLINNNATCQYQYSTACNAGDTQSGNMCDSVKCPLGNYTCDSNLKCGVAMCNNANDAATGQLAGGSGCNTQYCDMVAQYYPYCGVVRCPQGFGIYQSGGACYQDVCPANASLDANGNCKALQCPPNSTQNGGGQCVTN